MSGEAPRRPASFEERVLRMREIASGARSYGCGDRPHEQANEYYLDHLLEECVRRALRTCPRRPGQIDLLISLSGFSPTTTILTYELLRPRRLVVVSSEDASSSIDAIAGRVVGPDRLRYSQFSHRSCVPTDPLGIYRIVQDELDSHARRNDGTAVAYIDITGGRKVMSAAAALAAWQLNLGLCYVESEWDPALRQPIPGSDRLLLLDNPTSLFGQQEMQAAQQAFDGGAFEVARRRFEELAARLAEPGRARLMAALAELYRAWCDLDLAALPRCASQVQATLGPVRRTLSVSVLNSLEEQLAFLGRLADRERSSLLLGFHVLDDHYRAIGRQDFAALLSYRTIEGCLVERLRVCFPGFDASEPVYELISDDLQQLRRSWNELMNAIDRNTKTRNLPPYVGLFHAAVLLHLCGDELLVGAGIRGVEGLRKLRELARIRNESVLAHGNESVSKEGSERLNLIARDILRAYWALHYADAPLDQLCARLRFVRPWGEPA